MKIIPKLIRSIWLPAVLVVLGLPRIASAVSPIATLFTYDGQNQTRLTYDGDSQSAFNYDAAAVPVADERKDRTVGTGGLFADFAEFLAAKAAPGLPMCANQVVALSGR